MPTLLEWRLVKLFANRNKRRLRVVLFLVVASVVLFRHPILRSNNKKKNSPGKYPLFSCAQLLDDLHNHPDIPNQDPNLSRIYARRTITDPSFYISLHNHSVDPTRWDSIMEYGYYYETALTAAFLKILHNSPTGARVLDVGGRFTYLEKIYQTGPKNIDYF